MSKVSKATRAQVRKVRLEIRKLIKENDDLQGAVDALITHDNPTTKAAERRARKNAISRVVGRNKLLSDAANKIYTNITGRS